MKKAALLIAVLASCIAACGSSDIVEQSGGSGPVTAPPSPTMQPPSPPIPKGAGLSALKVSSAALSPAFAQNVARYRVAVEVMAQQPFTVTATPEDPNAVMTLNGKPLLPGVASAPLHVSDIYNPIEIRIRLPSGQTSQYMLLAAAAQDAYVKASNTRPEQYFSNDLAVSGDTLVVGAWGDASAATGIDGDENDTSAPHAGAAHVYHRDALGQWTHEAYLKASNTRADAYFGITVAVDGDTVVVGAQDEASAATGINGNGNDASAPGAGAAYVFRRVPCTPDPGSSSGSGSFGSTCQPWQQEAYIKASNTRAGAGFGTAVSIKGNDLVVGSWTESSAATGINGDQADTSANEAGAAYVFTRTGNTWTQQAYLKASNARALARFGNSVAIDGDTLAVGSLRESSSATGVNGNQADTGAPNSGAAYVFTRSGTTWTQQAYFKANNTNTNYDLTGGFSIGIALSGDNLAVGTLVEPSNATGTNGNSADTSALNAGAVYLYHRTGTAWVHEAYLKAPNTRALALFGYSLSLEGENLVVGSANESSRATGIDGSLSDTSEPNAGAAYLFNRNGGAWSLAAYLKASNTRHDALFGYAVSISGDRIAVGSRIENSGATDVGGNQADTSATNAGAVYVFR